MDDVDESLYSRQLYVLDKASMKRMQAGKVLIAGLGGLGVEIAKNIILVGVPAITLQDTNLTSFTDLSTQCFLTENDIGKNRAAQSLPKLKQLNPYVSLTLCEEVLTMKLVSEYDVIVLSEWADSTQETLGLCARIFCDFGNNFVIHEKDAEDPKCAAVIGVTRADRGHVTCLADTPHRFVNGTYVRFEGVNGMAELNASEPVEIEVTGPCTFKINLDTTGFQNYESGGFARQVKMSQELSFNSYCASLQEPKFLPTDFTKQEKNETMHAAFQAISILSNGNNGFPRPWNVDDANKLVEISKELISDDSVFDERLVRLISYTATGQVSPMNAFIGGVAAQEVIKACTGKFTPIHQWLMFDALECLPDFVYDNMDGNGVLKTPFSEKFQLDNNDRYASQSKLFGSELQSKLGNMRYLIVGAGAIGCELLKNFAMMGVAVGDGKLLLTDMDSIEKSNLSRQFLFRATDVGQGKAKVAANAIRKMNAAVNIEYYDLCIGQESEGTFNDSLFESIDGVANALDNVQSRLYMDKRCINSRKPLLDSGTLGTKGSTQVIIPDKTECYGDTVIPKQPLAPVCTLKSFPYTIEHTLQWSRDLFEGYFCQSAEIAVRYLKDPLFFTNLSALPEMQILEILDSLRRSFEKRPTSITDCVVWAKTEWKENFNFSINQLLQNFPPNHQMSDGNLFWTYPKQLPSPLIWKEDDDLSHEFVFCAANLRAKMFGIKENRMKQEVKQMANNIKVDPVPPILRDGVCSEDGKQEVSLTDIRHDIELIRKLIPSPEELKSLGVKTILPLEFEKDDDHNLHIDFITAASNLRALNYNIPLANRLESKRIAGNIIPAIATTTSVVSGLISLEFLKLANCKDVSAFRNAFVNLAVPFITLTETPPPVKQIYGNFEWTAWDRFEVNGMSEGSSEMTLKTVLTNLESKYHLKITMVTEGDYVLYGTMLSKKVQEERLRCSLSQLSAIVCNNGIDSHVSTYLFGLCCVSLDGEEVDVPLLRYTLS